MALNLRREVVDLQSYGYFSLVILLSILIYFLVKNWLIVLKESNYKDLYKNSQSISSLVRCMHNTKYRWGIIIPLILMIIIFLSKK